MAAKEFTDAIACPECKKEWNRLHPTEGICWDCAEAKRKRTADQERLEKILGPKGARDFTFQNFVQTDENSAAFKRCLLFNTREDNLYLWGPAGVGKTHLAFAIARRAITNGSSVGIFKCPSLMREFQGTPSELQKGLLERLTKYDLLVLDEIGIDRATEHSNKILYEIIDARLMDLKNGLILTANLSLSDLATKMDDTRLPDRLSGLCEFLKLGGESWRKKLRAPAGN